MYHTYSNSVNRNRVAYKKSGTYIGMGTSKNGRWGWRDPEWGLVEGTCGFRVGIVTASKRNRNHGCNLLVNLRIQMKISLFRY